VLRTTPSKDAEITQTNPPEKVISIGIFLPIENDAIEV
jgi:hypothetical protein